MKKVLLLLAAAALLASPAFGLITGTKHDLSSSGTNTYKGNSNEICVYCHTPHGGLTGGFAPLWNRNNGNNPTGFYNNPGTMNATVNNAGILSSDALLCMSCHDGASLSSTLRNPPTSGQPTYAGGGNIIGNANLGLDMSNDHPVGFVYATGAVDTEIRNTPTNGLKVTYGSGTNEMWCSSCHDVHDNTNAPFLAFTNAGSQLCLSCHIK